MHFLWPIFTSRKLLWFMAYLEALYPIGTQSFLVNFRGVYGSRFVLNSCIAPPTTLKRMDKSPTRLLLRCFEVWRVKALRTRISSSPMLSMHITVHQALLLSILYLSHVMEETLSLHLNSYVFSLSIEWVMRQKKGQRRWRRPTISSKDWEDQ